MSKELFHQTREKQLHSNLTREESDAQEMPLDFWNYNFNGHTGFKPEAWDKEATNLEHISIK